MKKMNRFEKTLIVCCAVIFTVTAATNGKREPAVVTINTYAVPAVEKTAKKGKADILSEEDVADIAKVVVAEAEGETALGKRYVADVIFNRVESKDFPDNIHDVVFQKNQFCTTGSRASAWEKLDDETWNDICKLVRDEYSDRKDKSIIFFRTSRYSDYGTPAFKYGAHYFSAE